MYIAMSLYKRVRRKIKKTRPQMQDCLKYSKERYWQREEKAKTYPLKDLVALFELYKLNGGSIEDFWKLLELSARRDK